MHTIYDTDLTDEHLIIIGRIAANWSLLEFLLTGVLAKLIGIDIKECRIITRSLNADTKLKKIKQIATYKGIPPSELSELSYLITRITRAKDNRNLVAHGVWAHDENNIFHLITYSCKHAEQPVETKMQIEDLNNIYDEIVSSLFGLSEWDSNLASSIRE